MLDKYKTSPSQSQHQGHDGRIIRTSPGSPLRGMDPGAYGEDTNYESLPTALSTGPVQYVEEGVTNNSIDDEGEWYLDLP